MITRQKPALTVLVACAILTGAGAWRTPAQPPAEPVPNASTEPKPSRVGRAGVEPVATIFGDVAVTREQFADHLIRQYGQKELELFINKQIVAHVFRSKGLVLKTSDIAAELDADCAMLGLGREAFAAKILPKYGKSLDQWVEDVVEPRLMLSQLLKKRIPTVTEAEMRQAFDVKYGEQLECRIISWARDKGTDARRAAEEIRSGVAKFDAYTHLQANDRLAASGGRVPPISRTPAPGAHPFYLAVVKLRPGETSPLVETDTGFVIVKCDGVIPADRTKSFEKEKPALLAEVASKRLERELPKLFAEYKREAAPKYHLTFPEREPAKK